MGHALVVPLVVSALLAWWPAAMLRRRDGVPHTRVFMALMAAVSAWCALSALHAMAPSLALKIAVAKAQYVAICSVAPLWLLLIADYAGVSWFARRGRVMALWTIPVASMILAATNESHHALWADVHLEAGRAIYTHAWWFHLLLGFNYLTLTACTLLLVRTLRTSPPPYRAQLAALIGAAIVPWIGNVLYVSGALPPGIDTTPLAFTVSGLLFAWGIYRNHLFDLIPVARDLVVDGLNDAVIVVDRTRRVVDLNAAAHALISLNADGRDDAIGRSIDETLPFLANTPLVAAGSVSSSFAITVGANAAHYDVRVMPLRRRNATGGSTARPIAWVMLLCDVTARRAAAAERDALRERVQEQQRRESLSVLAGGLAHDFNNLLAGIVGNADLLAMQVPPRSEMGSSVSAILLGAQRAADLVSKMLAYAGERHGSMGEVNLDALVRDLLPLLRSSAARHCSVFHKGQPATIVGDVTQVRQVVMNLIINAADAVDEGSGIVQLTTGVERLSQEQLDKIDFGTAAVPGRYAFFDVRDNGPGMDAPTLRHIFDPFFTTKPTGHGLGLAAVQGIVLGHRGALRVESSPAWGSRFRVWFPLAAGDPALRAEHDSRAELTTR